jgi:hypothetical protein
MTIQCENPNEERKFRDELREHFSKVEREMFYKEAKRVIKKEEICMIRLSNRLRRKCTTFTTELERIYLDF